MFLQQLQELRDEPRRGGGSKRHRAPLPMNPCRSDPHGGDGSCRQRGSDRPGGKHRDPEACFDHLENRFSELDERNIARLDSRRPQHFPHREAFFERR